MTTANQPPPVPNVNAMGCRVTHPSLGRGAQIGYVTFAVLTLSWAVMLWLMPFNPWAKWF